MGDDTDKETVISINRSPDRWPALEFEQLQRAAYQLIGAAVLLREGAWTLCLDLDAESDIVEGLAADLLDELGKKHVCLNPTEAGLSIRAALIKSGLVLDE